MQSILELCRDPYSALGLTYEYTVRGAALLPTWEQHILVQQQIQGHNSHGPTE